MDELLKPLMKFGPWVIAIFVLSSIVLPQAVRILRSYSRRMRTASQPNQ